MSLHLLTLERLGPDCGFERKLVWNPAKKPVAAYREKLVATALRKLHWRFFYEPVEYQDPLRVGCRKRTRVCFDYLVFLPGKLPIQIEVTTARKGSLRRKRGQARRVSQYWGILVVVLGPDDLDLIEENPYFLELIVDVMLHSEPVAPNVNCQRSASCPGLTLTKPQPVPDPKFR